MPQATYTALANITLGSSASSVTFSNIPNTYRDLILIVAGGSNSNNRAFFIDFNGDTANKSLVYMQGYGSNGYQSGTDTDLYLTTDSANYNSITQIFDYSATDKHKTVLIRDNLMTSSYVKATAGRWASTAAINSIKLSRAGYSWASGTVMTLYGVIA